ncbi:PREDICTED: septin-2B-like [Amphimedon queenslandica]|uniref:Septin-type G domain-containing protein n=1 Tax=Amphimedon queenslandica TaxID=400682 RepID=A0A1X7U6E5_AMPQE|nr:PREDICTED: septin-2B-like [Amphimedon queenslandica]|eukprot:XP_003388906.1 PREDICTED: septin-2B-like [Amphimedon queenslandica]
MSRHLGFHNLPYMAHRKSMKKGFRFTLMVVGESGLGKSTLIQSLFGNSIATSSAASHSIQPTTTIETVTADIEPFDDPRGVKMKLTVVDTPGFGESIDSSNCWQPIVDFINQKYDQYYEDESGFNRPNIEDNRVHCCLYFINPSCHQLKPLDIKCMQELHKLVNVVPVIAKADTLTDIEKKKLKTRLLNEINENGIQIYTGQIEEEEDSPEIFEIMNAIPMAVVGSTEYHRLAGEKVRGRSYPWGLVQVENKDHCDFLLLKSMLINTHMQDLKDCTQDIHYENFRKKKLKQEHSDLQQFIGVTSGGGAGGGDAMLLAKEREIEEMKRQMAMLQAQLQRGGAGNPRVM